MSTACVLTAKTMMEMDRETLGSRLFSPQYNPRTAGAEEDTAETAGAEEDTAETAGAEEDTAETAGAEEDTAETAGAEDNDTADVEPTSFNLQPGTTSSPQLTFVSTDGGDAPPASDTDIASSENGEHVYVVYEREWKR